MQGRYFFNNKFIKSSESFFRLLKFIAVFLFLSTFLFTASYVKAGDTPNGQSCGHDTECSSSNCWNRICCDAGPCCISNSNCYWFQECQNYMCIDKTNVENGGGCNRNDQCVSGYCDSGFCCDTGTCCNASTGVITCDDGWECNDNYQCFSSSELPNGSECGENSQCVSGNCNNGRCCEAGKTCCVPSQQNCSGDYWCTNSFYCQEKGDTGIGCSSDKECLSDSCYSRVCCPEGEACCRTLSDCERNLGYGYECSNYICSFGGLNANGESCGGNDECESGNCTNGTCCKAGETCCNDSRFCGFCTLSSCKICTDNHYCEEKDKSPNGTACDIDSDCTSFSCEYVNGSNYTKKICCPENSFCCLTSSDCGENGTCNSEYKCEYTYKLVNGMSCDGNEDCASGYCNNEHCCDSGTCCYDDGDCSTGYECHYNKYCVEKEDTRKENGEVCYSNSTCKSENCKNYVCCDAGKTCCSINDHCQDNYICNKSNYYCEANLKDDGEVCSLAAECESPYCLHNKCRPRTPYCGDGYCDSGEECDVCQQDCGNCRAGIGEKCATSVDCGDNYCVHNICREGKTYCGDTYCDTGEICSTCSKDCGECKREDGADCTSSAMCKGGYCVHKKCRSAKIYCGDGYCDTGEKCSDCEGDCGKCEEVKSTVVDSISFGRSGGERDGGVLISSDAPHTLAVSIPDNCKRIELTHYAKGSAAIKKYMGWKGYLKVNSKTVWDSSSVSSGNVYDATLGKTVTEASGAGGWIDASKFFNQANNKIVFYHYTAGNGIGIKIRATCAMSFCGDGLCNNNETCTACEKDCGACEEKKPEVSIVKTGIGLDGKVRVIFSCENIDKCYIESDSYADGKDIKNEGAAICSLNREFQVPTIFPAGKTHKVRVKCCSGSNCYYSNWASFSVAEDSFSEEAVQEEQQADVQEKQQKEEENPPLKKKETEECSGSEECESNNCIENVCRPLGYEWCGDGVCQDNEDCSCKDCAAKKECELLNNGDQCKTDFQCKSKYCKQEKCAPQENIINFINEYGNIYAAIMPLNKKKYVPGLEGEFSASDMHYSLMISAEEDKDAGKKEKSAALLKSSIALEKLGAALISEGENLADALGDATWNLIKAFLTIKIKIMATQRLNSVSASAGIDNDAMKDFSDKLIAGAEMIGGQLEGYALEEVLQKMGIKNAAQIAEFKTAVENAFNSAQGSAERYVKELERQVKGKYKEMYKYAYMANFKEAVSNQMVDYQAAIWHHNEFVGAVPGSDYAYNNYQSKIKQIKQAVQTEKNFIYNNDNIFDKSKDLGDNLIDTVTNFGKLMDQLGIAGSALDAGADLLGKQTVFGEIPDKIGKFAKDVRSKLKIATDAVNIAGLYSKSIFGVYQEGKIYAVYHNAINDWCEQGFGNCHTVVRIPGTEDIVDLEKVYQAMRPICSSIDSAVVEGGKLAYELTKEAERIGNEMVNIFREVANRTKMKVQEGIRKRKEFIVAASQSASKAASEQISKVSEIAESSAKEIGKEAQKSVDKAQSAVKETAKEAKRILTGIMRFGSGLFGNSNNTSIYFAGNKLIYPVFASENAVIEFALISPSGKKYSGDPMPDGMGAIVVVENPEEGKWETEVVGIDVEGDEEVEISLNVDEISEKETVEEVSEIMINKEIEKMQYDADSSIKKNKLCQIILLIAVLILCAIEALLIWRRKRSEA